MRSFYKKNYLEDYILDEHSCMVILPLYRVQIESVLKINEFIFVPIDYFDLDSVAFVDPFSSTIRGSLTFISGFDSPTLKVNPAVVFPYSLDWNKFFRCHSHKDDADLIRELSYKVEYAMDLIRFECCNLSMYEDLPAKAGVWNNMGFSGAFIYNPNDNEAYRIGAKINTHLIVDGVGLELPDSIAYEYDVDKGIGTIIKNALAMYTDALESSNNTSKYFRAISLIEFLASPYETNNFKEVKSQVICHFAKDTTDYHRLSNRFQYLSGKKEQNKEIGYRTLIVHQGKRLEDILTSMEINSLFLELDRYIKNIISDLFLFQDKLWDDVLNYRTELKEKLNIK